MPLLCRRIASTDSSSRRGSAWCRISLSSVRKWRHRDLEHCNPPGSRLMSHSPTTDDLRPTSAFVPGVVLSSGPWWTSEGNRCSLPTSNASLPRGLATDPCRNGCERAEARFARGGHPVRGGNRAGHHVGPERQAAMAAEAASRTLADVGRRRRRVIAAGVSLPGKVSAVCSEHATRSVTVTARTHRGWRTHSRTTCARRCSSSMRASESLAFLEDYALHAVSSSRHPNSRRSTRSSEQLRWRGREASGPWTLLTSVTTKAR
jgi:hypothetical protein